MDENQNNGVETTPENAPVQELEARIAQLEAEKQKVSAERDNYKKGLLQAKGYLPNTEEPQGDGVPSVEEVVKKVLTEKELDEKSQSIDKEQRELVQKLIEDNKKKDELIISLQNKSQVTPSASGTSVERDIQNTKGSGYWTAEQEATLKKRGLDPKKVWENVTKYNAGNIVG